MSELQRCPECDARIESINDVKFVEWDTFEMKWLDTRSPKVMYLVACSDCVAAIGGGIAAGK